MRFTGWEGCCLHSGGWAELVVDGIREIRVLPKIRVKMTAAHAALFSVISPLQAGDIDFVHLQDGLHDALRFFGILLLQHLAESGGDDLPGEAVFVFQPAAVIFFSASGKLFPELINPPAGFRN